ncbi:hypothetical protein [Pseudacidobacterium ailaaui]|uniref:hypothetical protein n=1 Tax=Pseudacidobacterium ailaaui TaxID=1382359 RepID=UPI0004794622|nr:hypothetical protein [Pseudacidobacterium ailaaui]MDI3255154.1 hypothetical protein [Bacillota bacterium]
MNETTEKEAATQSASPRPTRRRRGNKPEAALDEFVYCLEEGTGQDGRLVLSKPGPKHAIELLAFRKNVSYFRVQKFVAEVEERPEGNLIVGVPVPVK